MAESPSGLSDLHRHLDGSLRAATLDELAERAGRAVPEDLRFRPGMGLAAALDCFQFILAHLQDPETVERVAREICEDAEADGVSTLEIRFAPQLHGDSAGAAIDAALRGANRRAGLILCGLYGEDPAILDELVELAATRRGVVGIDLAGGPAPSHAWDLSAYSRPFQRAAELGLGRTVHAGEGRPPAEIRTAIEELAAQRIGHGTTLLDDPRVADLVIEKQVTIEACPTSNVHTGVLADVAEHPLKVWLARGIRVCVCPDNTFLSDVSASEELARVVAALELDDTHRRRLVEAGHAAAFSRGSPQR